MLFYFTIETHPITEITFPKVTVCPPKNTYTDLNYDLMRTGNMTLDNDTKTELTNYAVELLYDHLYDTIMTNLSKLEENDRYLNWYHGYTQIKLPYHNKYDTGEVNFDVYTSTTSGSITTQHFGDKFDADKVDTSILYYVKVNPPESVKNNPDVTLYFDIEKSTMKDLSSGYDDLSWDIGTDHIDTDITHINISKTNTPAIALQRKVLLSEVRKQKLELMPGFRFKWYYTGMEVEPSARYYHYTETRAFVRLGSHF